MSPAASTAIIPPDEERNAVDAQILQRVAAGDQSALGELYDRFSGPLFSFALRILSDPARAGDALHDAFVDVWEKAPDFEAARGHVFPWAFAFVRRHALDRLRSPSSSDFRPAVPLAADALSAHQCDALDLACFSGLALPQIAARLAAPPDVTRTCLQRALFALRGPSSAPPAPDERRRSAAALHALGLLEGGERSAFEDELARDHALRRLTDQLRDTVASLTLLVPPAVPPPLLRPRIMASIAARSTTPPDHVVPFRIPLWTGWAVAAGFLLATGYFAIANFNTRSQFDVLRENERLSGIEAKNLANLLEAERLVSHRQIEALKAAQNDASLLRLAILSAPAGSSSTARAAVAWNPRTQEGSLFVTGLPAPAAGEDYRLWLLPADGTAPIDAGVFPVAPASATRVAFKPGQAVKSAVRFAVRLAPADAAHGKPQGPVVLLGD